MMGKKKLHDLLVVESFRKPKGRIKMRLFGISSAIFQMVHKNDQKVIVYFFKICF